MPSYVRWSPSFKCRHQNPAYISVLPCTFHMPSPSDPNNVMSNSAWFQMCSLHPALPSRSPDCGVPFLYILRRFFHY